jgi:hypothetical protein
MTAEDDRYRLIEAFPVEGDHPPPLTRLAARLRLGTYGTHKRNN